MNKQKSYIKELGKSYAIDRTNFGFEQALKWTEKIDTLRATVISPKAGASETTKAMLEMLTSRKEYLQSALGLSDDEIAKLDRKLTPQDFDFACQRVVMLTQGMSEKEADEALNATTEDNTDETPSKSAKATD